MTVKLNFWDADEDGKVTLVDVFAILRNVVYITLACYVIIAEGQNPKDDVFTNWEMGLVVCSSFGAVLLEKFITLRWSK